MSLTIISSTECSQNQWSFEMVCIRRGYWRGDLRSGINTLTDPRGEGFSENFA